MLLEYGLAEIVKGEGKTLRLCNGKACVTAVSEIVHSLFAWNVAVIGP